MVEPRLSQLPRPIQRDVRAFFSTYSRACDLADRLLFSAGNLKAIDQTARQSPIGKLTPTSLYLHISALDHLPPLLRVYEGCARVLIGAVEGANVVKIHRDKPGVSYLSYPEFEIDPHPGLSASLLVNLQTLRVKYREYTDSANPPVLHRKETFLPAEHPLREKFARLTQHEERLGLYEEPHSIGTRKGWEECLKARGVRLAGHRICRSI